MDTEVVCPLCETKIKDPQESINLESLKSYWFKQYKIDISNLCGNLVVVNKFKCSHCDLGFFYPLMEGDGKFYAHLSKDSQYYEHTGKTEYTECSKSIDSNSTLLDIGSGTGQFYNYLKSKNVEYFGVEFNEDAVRKASENNINVKNISLDELVKKDKKFDYVCIFQVLEHINGLDSFLGSVKSLMAKSGELFIAVPDNDSFINQSYNNLLNLPPHHILLWNEKSLRYLSSKCGLEVLSVQREKVTSVHQKWAKTTYSNKFINGLLRRQFRALDNSRISKVVNKLSSIYADFFCGISKDAFGHTIIIHMKKS